ncbi:MAG: peptidase M48 [Clostridia bacterium]|nr:peptidase M48 [Clostridia bacterium]
MKLRVCVIAILGVVLLAVVGCKEAEMLGGIAQSFGGPVGGYAESAIKGGAAVAKSMEDFTPEQEYYIGRAVTAKLLTTYRPLKNSGANDYVNRLGQSLAMFSALPLTYGGYHFQIVDSDDINAFAAPGGLILVTRGLIRCCPNETALAAVLAHEIAHVQNKDALRAISKSRVTQALGVIGGETVKHLAGAELAELTGIFSDSVGDVMTTMVNNGYSRSYEYQADQGAVTILNRAGYDPAGLSVMLRTMQTRLTPGGSDFASTHPAPADRLEELADIGQRTPAAEPASRTARFTRALASL